MPKAAEGENDIALHADLRTSTIYDVAGRVVVISGGGSGIGAMLASGFVQNGAKVYIFSRKDTSIFAKELTAKGPGTCIALTADMQKPESIAGVVEAVSKAEGKVDVLLNNAGTNMSAPIESYSRDGFAKVMDVNVTSVFYMTQQFLPLLQKASQPGRPARVINVGSINGIDPPVLMDTFAYSASKSAVGMLSRHLAARLAPEVNVNTICPGPFMSRMMRGTISAAGEDTIASTTLAKRLGAPEDICGAALMLSSSAGSYMTGVTLPVDGGALLSRM
eukprot:TRINITY_DN11207_c0_g1_i1.p1 TRINITY_DN11207_c0_g1~~TRINITY_DN11207_c0_g1_i1.p1  ORF type:complete len:302 (-),score=56.55 TRINITY_DN11207_c0_g1_i1:209-1039(-)